MYIKYTGWEAVDWIHLANDSVTWVARALLSNGSVNNPQTVFSVGSVQRSYLKNKQRNGSVLCSCRRR
jgi:hypothetical protein